VAFPPKVKIAFFPAKGSTGKAGHFEECFAPERKKSFAKVVSCSVFLPFEGNTLFGTN
jgi:hypothetical protein